MWALTLTLGVRAFDVFGVFELMMLTLMGVPDDIRLVSDCDVSGVTSC